MFDVVWALYNANKDLAQGDDEQRRQLTRKICEQFRFEMGPDWGHKSTTSAHPPSKDVFAWKGLGDGRLEMWDWQNGATREPHIYVGQPPPYTDAHHFIAVSPVDHLGDTEPPPTEPPPSGDLEERVAALERKVTSLMHHTHETGIPNL